MDAHAIKTALPLALTVTASGIINLVMPLSSLCVISQATIISGIATALKINRYLLSGTCMQKSNYSRNKWHSFVICYKHIAPGTDFDRNSVFYPLFIFFLDFVLLP